MAALTNMGLYSPLQVERLTGIAARRIRRWLLSDIQGPLWRPEPVLIGVPDTLSFRDLLQLRVVAHLRKHNVRLPVIRELIAALAEYYQAEYPLIQSRFGADIERVSLISATGHSALIPQCLDQLLKSSITIDALFLQEGIEFDDEGCPVRCHLNLNDPDIIIDPRFGFGKPIVLPSHMSTATLAQATRIEVSASAVARQFDISVEEVELACSFEEGKSLQLLPRNQLGY